MRSDYVQLMDEEPKFRTLLEQIDDITIIEYDFNDYSFSLTFAEYIAQFALSTDIVTKIILLGEKNDNSEYVERRLLKYYPNTKIIFQDQDWKKFTYNAIEIPSTLVVHFAASVGLVGERTRNHILDNWRCVYSLLFWGESSEVFGEIKISSCLTLKPYNRHTRPKLGPESDYCSELKKEIEEYRKVLSKKDFFYHCVRSSKCGCTVCNQCWKYAETKRCPYMLSVVAGLFRNEGYLPKNEKIAHNWEIMAANQCYLPSEINTATDILEGTGCDKDEMKAFGHFVRLANITGDSKCIEKVVELSSKLPEINSRVAIPYLSKQAADGNENAILRLYDMFENKECGLPDDLEQKVNLLEMGAATGNVDYIERIAQLNERNREWKTAYEWYKKYYELLPELKDEDKLKDIRMNMISDGLSLDSITSLGMRHIYGDIDDSDVQLGEEYLNYAIDKGYAKAMGLYGWLKYKGCVVEQDIEKGLDLIEAAANAKHLPSMDLVYKISIEEGLENEIRNYAAKIKRAVNKGVASEDLEAVFYKGKYAYEGRLFKSEYSGMAEELIEKAAKGGIADAQYLLSIISDSYQKRSCYLNKAAENGNINAMGKKGVELAKSSYRDNAKTFRYLSIASVLDDAEIMYYFGKCYANGIGTSVSAKSAFFWIEKAAKAQFETAYEDMCKYYFDGKVVEQNYQLAYEWGEKAIKTGLKNVVFETAYAAAEIGKQDRAKELYQTISNGNSSVINNIACLENDRIKKAQLFKKAADMGSAVAQSNIASRLMNGNGIERDTTLAIEYYEKSANQGYIGSIKELARIYHYGVNTDVDEEKAIKWYMQAIGQDDNESIYKLGTLYESAKCISRDFTKALEYYKLAAEKGITKAMNAIGNMYRYGIGVSSDLGQAVFWYRKSAKKGDREAIEILTDLNANWVDEDGNIIDSVNDSNN